MKKSIFFLCHQDDEFGIFYKISEEIKTGSKVICIYLTNGVNEFSSSRIRNNESNKVLNFLGVKKENILYVGEEIGIPDLKLTNHLRVAFKWLNQYLKSNKNIKTIYVPAWEGGHPDHDCLSYLVNKLAKKYKLNKRVFNFSLYNSFNAFWPFFNVLKPVPKQGTILNFSIPIKDRITYLFLLFSYKSQVKSFIGLFPAILLHYFFHGTQNLQIMNLSRLEEKPHLGMLYYERRNFMTWKKFKSNLSQINFL
jgi:LmbE family N-acetylglucosaminyl deacetylase